MHQGFHAVLPLPNHDEASRQDFTVAFRREVIRLTGKDGEAVFDKRAAPAFTKANGHAPGNRHDARQALRSDTYWQIASALKIIHQEVLWDSVSDSIERQYGDIVQESRRLAQAHRHGTLRLNPGQKVPRYLNAVDIHMMPGNYDTELADDDIFAGALYDRGVFLRVMGSRGGYNETFGTDIAKYVQTRFPNFAPKRILDLGCSVGGSTLGLAQSFPAAEIFAIDVAAPMLRYAHARAESLRQPVHFSQQDAEHLDFPDGHFDFVFSFALLHETSTKACRNVVKEAHRVLAPGGILVFMDLPQWNTWSPFQAAAADWDTLNNAEPFIGALGDIDRKRLLADSGFAANEMVHEHVDGMTFPIFGAHKKAA